MGCYMRSHFSNWVRPQNMNTGFWILVFVGVVGIAAEKKTTEKQLLETHTDPKVHKHDSLPHNHFEGKIEQVLKPPKRKMYEPKVVQKDLKQSDSVGLGYYGVPIAYGAAAVYPSYYPAYYPYYRRPYLGYGVRPVFGFKAYGALPIYSGGVVVG